MQSSTLHKKTIAEFAARPSSALHSTFERNFPMTRLMLTAGLAALISGATASQASAADHTVIETGAVKTNDLNLNTVQGVDGLFHRVDLMASRLCAESTSAVFPRAERDMWECHRATMARALGQVHAPLVTAAYARRFGQSATRLTSR
jgi:UrcA family protein